MSRLIHLLYWALAVSAFSVLAEDHDSGGGGHRMTMDVTGMVMNFNSDVLPEDCDKVSRDYEFTVSAGAKFAERYADNVFGFSQHEFRVEPCSRITVTFNNEDQVRHQWMVHGLPKYLYDQGMFHIEAIGGETQKGTFIVPSDDNTYLVHCDLAQHMEKGMKAQLVVGRGGGDLWSIPGVSAEFERGDQGLPRWSWGLAIGSILLVSVVTGFASRMLRS